ncbi:MAG TPA: TRAP transporter substrate-binding protein [Steroidobacteraceae bacterium]|nr:TRAP transporter substrate-binding protein [Steroidobacteraceae bacterium]
MKRRDFVTGLGASAAAAGLVGCEREAPSAGVAAPGQTFSWKMVTTWPPNFPALGTGALRLAQSIEAASGGRIRVKVYGAGELVPAFEVFDAVASGTAELGHGGAYYWKGKAEAASFFSAVPFGLNALEMNAWLYFGGGWDLWKEVYAPFGLLPAPAGNSGVQMGGWFNREIRSVDDLKGLKMRIPGLGGEVLARAGGNPQTTPGSEIFTAMQTGVIDATEWVGPYNDLAFGLHRVAKYYYYPGWHEPGTTLECIVNQRAFDALPDDLREIVLLACRATNDTMLAEFTARNHEALATLVNEHGVELRAFPTEVLARLKVLSREVVAEKASQDPMFAKVLASYSAFESRVSEWMRISEQAYLATRDLR